MTAINSYSPLNHAKLKVYHTSTEKLDSVKEMEPDDNKPSQRRRGFRNFLGLSKREPHRIDEKKQKSRVRQTGQSVKPDTSQPSEAPGRPEQPKQTERAEPQIPSAPLGDEATISDAHAPAAKDDLWGQAFQQLHPKLQASLRARGMDETRAVSMKDQIDAFKHEAERLQEASKERDWKVPVKGHDIHVRNLTIRLVGWAIKIGDVAMPFAAATSPAAAVWGVVTLFLQEIQNFDAEKRALLSIAEKIAQAMFLGQLYSGIYTLDRTRNDEVVTRLHQAIVDLYACVLKLLVTSSSLASNTVSQFCQSMFKNEKPSGLLLELADLKASLEEAAIHCEATANALHSEELRALFQDTQLLQRQFFQTINQQKRNEIRDWVSQVPYGIHHQQIEENRSKGTGDWLIQHEKFLDWIQSPSSQVLWLQGSPGAGKTFLTANVVTYFESRVASEGQGFAYFFCNRDEEDRRTSLPILRTLVRQLATTNSIHNSIRGSLRNLWEDSLEKRLAFGRQDCLDQLLESFAAYPTTFIVLDALDEVIKDELQVLLREIRSFVLNTSNVIKLFVASRPEVRVPHPSWPTITIQAGDNLEDIKQHVEGEIDRFIDEYHTADLETVIIPAVEEKKDEILQSILERCDNMFLWASLQTKRVLACNSVEAIEDVLGALPVGLDKAYDKIFELIHRLPQADQMLVERALKWVHAAPKLLTTEEILSAVRVGAKSSTYIRPVRKEILVSICSNLLIVDSEDQWRFFHLSAREYLDNKIGFGGKSQETHSFCAEICFHSLLLSFDPQNIDFAQADPKEQNNPSRLENPFHPANPFSRHCQLYWPLYARTEHANAPHLPILQQFLGSPNEGSSFYLRWRSYEISFSSDKYARSARSFMGGHQPALTRSSYQLSNLPEAPIFLVAYFTLYETLHDWCDNSDMDPLQVTSADDYLLTVAARSGCMPLCASLISRGQASSGDFQLYLSQALVGAVEQENMQMVEFLIHNGADVNLVPESKGLGYEYSSPVDPAARSGNLDLIKYLVEQAGAIVRDALAWAVETESPESGLDIVHYLIQNRQIDPNLPLLRHFGGSPLIAAARSGRRDIVSYYLDKTGVDVNAIHQTSSVYSTALGALVERGSLEYVKYFIENWKVDVNIVHESGLGNALCVAIAYARLDIVKYLVQDAGADVNIQLKFGGYGSALAMAIALGYLDIVYFLFDYAHATLNVPLLCGEYGSAFAAAFVVDMEDPTSLVNMDLVRLFIQAGADVNMEHQTGRYGTPFVAAALFAHDVGVIQYLVDEGQANIHAHHMTGDYGSALVAAANGGNVEVTKYLVDVGADPNLQFEMGAFGTCLVAAAASRHENPAVVKYLVDAGVDVNVELQVGVYHSPLVAAAAKGHLAKVRYLVEEVKLNIDLHLKTGSFGNALAATILGPFDFSIDIYLISEPKPEIESLLQGEADSGERVTLYSIFAPPHIQSETIRIVEYLVGAGADVNLDLQVGAYGSVLAAAIATGSIEQVKFLVEEGRSDVNAQLATGFFGSALMVAILANCKTRKLSSDDIIDLWRMVPTQFRRIYGAGLVPIWGVDLRVKVPSMIDSLDGIMAYLLESGANVNQQLIVGPYGSALAAAATVGSLWNVKFLVEKGNADVNLQLENGSYANAYEAAIANGHDDIAEYLMQKGRDPEAIGSEPLD